MIIARVLLAACLAHSSTMAEGQDQVIPDLQHALNEGVLIAHRVEEHVEVVCVRYGAKVSFGKLKKELREFLGNDWSELEIPPAMKQGFIDMNNRRGLKERAYFVSKVFPNYKVELNLKLNKNGEVVSHDAYIWLEKQNKPHHDNP